MATRQRVKQVVLVEGESDKIALLTLAKRMDLDLAGEGVGVVAMGGITNTRAYAMRYGPRGIGADLSGLYDIADEAKLRRGLAAAGLGSPPTSEELPELGFFTCTRDLEDELIRALGIGGVEQVIEAAGEARSLRLLTAMPAKRDWSKLQLIRRFLGSKSGRKARYAVLMVDALELDRAPQPLVALLRWSSGARPDHRHVRGW